MPSSSRPVPLLLAFLGLAPACGDLDLPTAGELALTEATDDTGEISTGELPGTDGIHTSTAGDATSHGSADGDATGGDIACDDDPACGPDETVDNCPSQCSECGDGIVSGDEDCDNGVNNSSTHYYYKPSSAACAPGCRHVDWCGDGLVNGPEPCDDAHKQTGGCEIDCSIPRCGDGIVNAHRDEACDDFNNFDGDGCTADCLSVERSVFVTQRAFAGDLDPDHRNPEMLSGIRLADYRCNWYAQIYHLPGTYKAWLSDAATSPAERFDTEFTGVYRLPLGNAIIARGWADLTDGTIEHPIDLDANASPIAPHVEEDKVYLDRLVWSNTNPDGTRASQQHCANFTSADVKSTTTVGYLLPVDEAWTDVLDGQSCLNDYRFYCFEDPDVE